MPNYPVYFDLPVAYQLAHGLIGSEVVTRRQTAATSGISFKVIFTATETQDRAVVTKTENLLPEVLMEALREAATVKATNLSELRPRLLPGAPAALQPGTAVLFEECAFEAPKDELQPSEVFLAGEDCSVHIISSGLHQARVYGSRGHQQLIESMYGQPLSILTIARYCQPYRVPGAVAVNLGFRLVGAWIL